MNLLFLKNIFFIFVFTLFSNLASAIPSVNGLFVIGVVGVNKPLGAVVLIKNKEGRILPTRTGQKLPDHFGGLTLASVSSKYAVFKSGQSSFRMKIGTGEVESIVAKERDQTISANLVSSGIEKKGNEVSIAKDFKEHLINERLDAVLMQAAAVPHVVNGRLKGFEIWEIEDGSLFNALGLQNGDVVTAIDGREISNASLAIRQLNSLKTASALSFSYVRNGTKQDVSVRVQ